MFNRKILVFTLLIAGLLTGCSNNSSNDADLNSAVSSELDDSQVSEEVIIYTAVEQQYCQPLFDQFESETGIKVLPVYDSEANKTTGLVNRIIAEVDQPVCDVFWNNEFIQTISLQEQSLLEVYNSIVANDIPDAYKDVDGYWTAIGGRARVLLVNGDLLTENQYPTTVYNFSDGSFNGEDLALAYPAFGTTKTQVAAMYALLGKQGGKEFLTNISSVGVQIVDGNSVTKDMAAAGQVAVGYTDTDDAKVAIEAGYNVVMVYPDQEKDGIGTLITPSTIALINNAPNQENGKLLIDFLLSVENEQAMINNGFFDVSVRSGESEFGVKGMDLNLREIYNMLEVAAADVEEIFINAN